MIEPQTKPLERAVRAWIAAGSEIPSKYVIPGNKAYPAPAGVLYATVTMIENRRDGTPWTRADGTDVAVYVSRSIRYKVGFYRDGAQDAALAFSTWAGGQYGILDAHTRGLTFLGVSSIRQADALISSRWEPRVELDVSVAVVAVDSRPDPGGFDTLSIVVVPETLPDVTIESAAE